MTRARHLPRPIAPELIENGDKIRVIFPEVEGVKMTHEGIVFRREDRGPVRYLYTGEGATLVAWEPGKQNLTILLLDRPPASQIPMFDLEETRKRIS